MNKYNKCNEYNKTNQDSIKSAVFLAILIISITVFPILFGAWGSSINFFVLQTYIVMLFHCFIGIIYSTFKTHIDNKSLYAIIFFISIVTLSVLWGLVSFTFLTGDYVFGPIGLITLVPALIGVAIYEILSLIVSGLKKIIKQGNIDENTKVSSVKSIIVVCILTFLGNITPWLLKEWFDIVSLVIINILGMALVNTVVNARKKWIPIVAFLSANVILLPINIWLLNVNGIIK